MLLFTYNQFLASTHRRLWFSTGWSSSNPCYIVSFIPIFRQKFLENKIITRTLFNRVAGCQRDGFVLDQHGRLLNLPVQNNRCVQRHANLRRRIGVWRQVSRDLSIHGFLAILWCRTSINLRRATDEAEWILQPPQDTGGVCWVCIFCLHVC